MGQSIHCFGRNSINVLCHVAREVLSEVPDEEWNILFPFPEGWNVDGEDIQAIKQVGTKLLLPGSSIISLSAAPMSDKLVSLLASQPNVTMAIGTVVQPLQGLDTVTGLELDQFSKMSGGFHFLEAGPFQKDDDILIDEFTHAKRIFMRVTPLV